MIKVKRIYDPPDPDDGIRILVDRIWPRGIKKETARIDEWLKEIAPSDELRKWFGHRPERWEEFKRRYFEELDGKGHILGPLLEKLKGQRITLLYSAKDREHNNAVALKVYLVERLGKGA